MSNWLTQHPVQEAREWTEDWQEHTVRLEFGSFPVTPIRTNLSAFKDPRWRSKLVSAGGLCKEHCQIGNKQWKETAVSVSPTRRSLWERLYPAIWVTVLPIVPCIRGLEFQNCYAHVIIDDDSGLHSLMVSPTLYIPAMWANTMSLWGKHCQYLSNHVNRFVSYSAWH